MLTYTRQFPFEIEIDGETVRGHVRRMTDGEYKDFTTAWNAERRRLAARQFVDRRPGDEGLTDDQVRLKREADLTVDEITTRRARERFDDQAGAELTTHAITDFVTFAPGQIQDEGDDGKPVDVTTGAQILRCYATRDDVLGRLFAEVFLQNTLSAEQKKRWASRPASARSSSASTTTIPGSGPASTVAPADERGCAPSGTATDTATASSGTTQTPTSSGTTVRSS